MLCIVYSTCNYNLDIQFDILGTSVIAVIKQSDGPPHIDHITELIIS